VPSRAGFPRGFLWDEGFHLLVIIEWDLDLALEIVQSWLNLMDDDGWIAREQMLGAEARSRVPAKFQTQYPNFANPPTIFMVIDFFVEILSGRKKYHGYNSKYMQDHMAGTELLEGMYDKLQKWYTWFRRTQAGSSGHNQHQGDFPFEGYRWRGRTEQHCLPSGLDDYPRPSPPHPGELHVDALAWVGTMARTLGNVAGFLNKPSENDRYQAQTAIIKASLVNLHWDWDAKTYCDSTVKKGGREHVCHKGYVSLMPFLVGMMDHDERNMRRILDLIRDESELWTTYGLRSLSKKNEFYGKGENYWRGPIWVNMNYLALVQLLVGESPGSQHIADLVGRTSLRSLGLFKHERRKFISTCDAISSPQFPKVLKRPASHGNSTTRRLVLGRESKVSLDGHL